MTYYNTTTLCNPVLERYESKSIKQEAQIMAAFHKYPKLPMTPHDVLYRGGFTQDVPITSIRRGLSNLTKAGYLVKTDLMKVGPFGRVSHTWTINNGGL
jgi:hypothetical protein